MNKSIKAAAFLNHLFDDTRLAAKPAVIVEAIWAACSPRLSALAQQLPGTEASAPRASASSCSTPSSAWASTRLVAVAAGRLHVFSAFTWFLVISAMVPVVVFLPGAKLAQRLASQGGPLLIYGWIMGA